MRAYRAPDLRCAKCGGPFRARGDVAAEHVVRGADLLHPVCSRLCPEPGCLTATGGGRCSFHAGVYVP